MKVDANLLFVMQESSVKHCDIVSVIQEVRSVEIMSNNVEYTQMFSKLFCSVNA